MRKLVIVLFITAISAQAFAARPVNVRGHIRSDGPYVMPHVRTAPNHTKLDNWSTKGNFNPYTGEEGTQKPYR